MRQKRAKTYRKLIAAHIRYFGLRPPLQVVVDAPMATTLAAMKIAPEDVPVRLEAVLQVSAALPSGARPQSLSAAPASTPGSYYQQRQQQQQQQQQQPRGTSQRPGASAKAALVKPMITQCSITELYIAQKNGGGEAESRAVDLAKTWERRFCNHKTPMPGDRCISEIVGDTNKHRYVLAVNSAGLRSHIRRNVAGVAVVHANDHQVLVLEPMSDLTKVKCDQLERQKLEASGVLGKRPAADEGAEASGSEDGNGSEGVAGPAAQQQQQGKKKAKGPNPLSVKKPKKETRAAGAAAPAGRSGAARRKKKKARQQASAAGAGDA